jgi:HSP20 family protein
MPTIIRRSFPSDVESRREVFVTTTWHVHSNLWTPPTDVYETEENFVVKVEVAGMHEDDFEVSAEDQILMIRGSRPDINERRAYHQMEIRFGKFEIALGLPRGVDLDKAAAEYKDGFLIVIFPKIQAKQIEVE